MPRNCSLSQWLWTRCGVVVPQTLTSRAAASHQVEVTTHSMAAWKLSRFPDDCLHVCLLHPQHNGKHKKSGWGVRRREWYYYVKPFSEINYIMISSTTCDQFYFRILQWSQKTCKTCNFGHLRFDISCN